MADYDILIIGGGPGGYSAALRAVQHGFKTAIIEKERLGGTCLHKGCVPTKALIKASSMYSMASNLSSFGINIRDLSFDWSKIQEYKSGAVKDLYLKLSSLIKAKKIELIKGEVKLYSNTVVKIDNQEITADKIILAVGSRPAKIDLLPNSDLILDSNSLLEIKSVPKTLTVIGGGYIGVEFASLFNKLGTEVNIIEAAPDILMGFDSEIRNIFKEKILEQGIEIKTDTEIISVKEKGEKIEVKAKRQKANLTFESQLLLVAVGRKANVANLGLERIGVKTKEGFIATDSYLKTSIDNIYAVGDCINTIQLAHVAFAEGIAVADFIATSEAVFPYYQAVPRVVYAQPEIAAVGETEDSAIASGMRVKTALYNFDNNPKAVIDQSKDGLVKIISDTENTILGVHIIGENASNLIAEVMLALGLEADVNDLAHFIHPHPTLTEAIGEAALKLAGRPLHSI